MSQTIESVAILGGGFMGAGIAESASIAGVPVIIRELPEFIDAARARLEKSLDGAVKRGSLARSTIQTCGSPFTRATSARPMTAVGCCTR